MEEVTANNAYHPSVESMVSVKKTYLSVHGHHGKLGLFVSCIDIQSTHFRIFTDDRKKPNTPTGWHHSAHGKRPKACGHGT